MEDHKPQQEEVGVIHDNKLDNRLFSIKEILTGNMISEAWSGWGTNNNSCGYKHAFTM